MERAEHVLEGAPRPGQQPRQQPPVRPRREVVGRARVAAVDGRRGDVEVAQQHDRAPGRAERPDARQQRLIRQRPGVSFPEIRRPPSSTTARRQVIGRARVAAVDGRRGDVEFAKQHDRAPGRAGRLDARQQRLIRRRPGVRLTAIINDALSNPGTTTRITFFSQR